MKEYTVTYTTELKGDKYFGRSHWDNRPPEFLWESLSRSKLLEVVAAEANKTGKAVKVELVLRV